MKRVGKGKGWATLKDLLKRKRGRGRGTGLRDEGEKSFFLEKVFFIPPKCSYIQ